MPAKYCCLPSMMKFVPEADGKELASAARRDKTDENVSLEPDQLAAGSAQATPAKDVKVMRFFMLRLKMCCSLPETREIVM